MNFKQNLENYFVLALSVAAVYLALSSFTGMLPWDGNIYNSYSLQADAWLHGRLALPKNYEHLELAIYNSEYFVSFPPFPSVIMIPFVLIFGTNTPDNIINVVFVFISAVYSFKLAKNFGLNNDSALFSASFLILGSNMVFLMFRGWVWFFAQVLSFMFCILSLYFSTTPGENNLERDSMLAFLFLAFSVGCRPFQAVYGFVTLFLVYYRWEKQIIYGNIGLFFVRLLLWGLPAVLVCVAYAALNYFRFGNPIEFGHNYLPEFVNSSDGQFNLSYLLKNLKSIIYIPPFTDKGFEFPRFNGFSAFMVNPVLGGALFISTSKIFKTKIMGIYSKFFVLLCIVSVIIHFILICMHKTMGGWHFGNRYTVDCLPYAFLLFIDIDGFDDSFFKRASMPLFMFGLGLNVVGTILIYK